MDLYPFKTKPPRVRGEIAACNDPDGRRRMQRGMQRYESLRKRQGCLRSIRRNDRVRRSACGRKRPVLVSRAGRFRRAGPYGIFAVRETAVSVGMSSREGTYSSGRSGMPGRAVTVCVSVSRAAFSVESAGASISPRAIISAVGSGSLPLKLRNNVMPS